MTQQERKIIATKISQCALFYGKYDLGVEAVSMMIDVIINFYKKNCGEVLEAFDAYMRDSKNRFFPSPAQLREYLEPEVDNKKTAIEVVNQIQVLINKYGRSWIEGYFDSFENENRERVIKYFYGKNREKFKNFKDALFSEIGEVGVRMVAKLGGWELVCDSFDTKDRGQFVAQLREAVESSLYFSTIGKSLEELEMPEKRKGSFFIEEKPRDKNTEIQRLMDHVKSNSKEMQSEK